MNIDWSKAPEQATHFSPARPGFLPAFWRIDGASRSDSWVILEDGTVDYYANAGISPETRKTLIPRPVMVEWNGEGNPPAGTVCELQLSQQKIWRLANVLYSSDEFCVVKIGEREACHRTDNCTFRPLRTAEQIAADERAALIKEACADIETAVAPYNETIDCSAAIRATVEAMLASGYRKQVQP